MYYFVHQNFIGRTFTSIYSKFWYLMVNRGLDIIPIMIVQKLPHVPYLLYTAVAFELPAQAFYQAIVKPSAFGFIGGQMKGIDFALLNLTGAHKPTAYRRSSVRLSLVVAPLSPGVQIQHFATIKKKPSTRDGFFLLAEMQGFEPQEDLRPRLISSQVH